VNLWINSAPRRDWGGQLVGRPYNRSISIVTGRYELRLPDGALHEVRVHDPRTMVTVSRGIEVTASFTGSGVAPEALRPTAAIGS
jgi:hypothetical protein